MPKKHFALPQGARQFQILEAVASLGLAEAGEVLAYLEERLTSPLMPEDRRNLLRNIHRDLNQLSESGALDKRYFTKDLAEAEVPPDSLELEGGEVKNIYKVKYCALGSEDNFPGAKLIARAGGQLLLASGLVSWRARPLGPLMKENEVHVCFGGGGAELLTISASMLDLPFTLVVGRRDPKGGYLPSKAELGARFTNRSALLLCADRSVSRPAVRERLGHFALLFHGEEGFLTIEDLGSKAGTSWCPAVADSLISYVRLCSTAKTELVSEEGRAAELAQMHREGDWRNIGSETACGSPGETALSSVRVRFPVFVKAGAFVMLIAKT